MLLINVNITLHIGLACKLLSADCHITKITNKFTAHTHSWENQHRKIYNFYYFKDSLLSFSLEVNLSRGNE